MKYKIVFNFGLKTEVKRPVQFYEGVSVGVVLGTVDELDAVTVQHGTGVQTAGASTGDEMIIPVSADLEGKDEDVSPEEIIQLFQSQVDDEAFERIERIA